MEDLFPRAKDIGLREVRSWLPDGVMRGDEWVAKDPNRPSDNLGEFSINLKSGRWSNFATPDACGNDVISLYAYIFEDRLRSEAAKHKTYRSGLQIEAAKKILLDHDSSYFPSKNDNFIVPSSTSGGYWDGWHYVSKGIPNPPDIDVSWYEEKWGTCINKWEFKSKDRIVMYVCRFQSGEKKSSGKNKKNDRPFTLWSNGSEYKWRSKAPDDKYPLWNQQDLETAPNAYVILSEGQKDAELLKKVMYEYACVGWYGGVNALDKQNWEPLRGRTVYYPFDADAAGRKTLGKIKTIAAEYDMMLYPVYPPQNAKPGWSPADEISNGWDHDRIEEHLKNIKTPEEGKPELEESLEDESAFKFEVLGYAGDDIYFYPHGKKQVTKYKASALTKGALLTLQDRQQYGRYFGKDDGGIAWDAAVNTIIRIAEEKPIFKFSRIRGTGVWMDSGKMVINTGESLIFDGEEKKLHQSPGEYIYEKDKYIPYCKNPAMDLEQASKVSKLMEHIDWKDPIFGKLLVGWMTLAPFGGALKWRSYAWLVGPTGSGKSYILENIVGPLVSNKYGIYAKGTSTQAGIRSALANNSIATVIDEMESDNPRTSERIDEILRMFREGSSESGAVTLHGSSDGEGREWIVQSMALFASIGASIRHGADQNRFTQLVLSSPYNRNQKERAERFEALQEAETILTPTFCGSFHTRTYELFPEVRRCIDIIVKQATELTGSRRNGDQIGTLLAGAWMNEHDTAATAAEAREWLLSLDLKKRFCESKDKSDEELVLDEIMSSRIEITGKSGTIRTTIGSALLYWWNNRNGLDLSEETPEISGAELNRVKKDIQQYGIKTYESDKIYYIDIAKDHSAIKKILRDTPWHSNYDSMLSRLDFCDKQLLGPARFSGLAKRFRRLYAADIFEDIPF